MKDYTLVINHSLDAINSDYRYTLYNDHNPNELEHEIRTSSKNIIKINIDLRGLKIKKKMRLIDRVITVHLS